MIPFNSKYEIDWQTMEDTYPWVAAMRTCPQNPKFHAEGDVRTHTEMVCAALIADPEFQKLSENKKRIALYSAATHDIAKSVTTYTDDDGSCKTKNHSGIGALMTREVMYKNGFDFQEREIICSIVKNHLKPFFLIGSPVALRQAHYIALTTPLHLLKLQARADGTGRIAKDQSEILDNVEMFYEFCEEEGLVAQPKPYSSPHSRITFFKSDQLVRPYEAYLDARCTVTVLSGLPGAGKDTWVKKNAGEQPVISLDDIRREFKIKPTDDQGFVIAEAQNRAKQLLRERKSFIYNATNITKQLRTKFIDMCLAYDAYVKLVYIEVPYKTLIEQNGTREHSVPLAVIEKLIRKLEVPDLSEAHEVIFA